MFSDHSGIKLKINSNEIYREKKNLYCLEIE